MKKTDSLVLKGIAICAMLWHHLFVNADTFSSFVVNTAVFAKICVSIFIFVSGYGLCVSWKNLRIEKYINRSYKFIIERLIKFYFKFWVVFLLFVPITVLVFGRTLLEAYGGNVIIRTVEDFFCVGNYNYVATWWFNTLILIYYVLFPLFYLMVKRFPILTFLLFLGITKFALYENYMPYVQKYPFAFMLYMLNQYTVVFIGGIVLSMYWDKISKINSYVNKKLFVSICAFLLLFFSTMRVVNIVPFFHGWRMDVFIILVLSLLLNNLKISSRILVFLGNHSANMYLIHAFIFVYWISNFIYSFKYSLLIFIVLLLISLFISICLEQIKKYIGFYKLEKAILTKI